MAEKEDKIIRPEPVNSRAYAKLQTALAASIFFIVLLLGFILGGVFQEYKDAEKYVSTQYNLTGRGCTTSDGHIGFCGIMQVNECSAMLENLSRNLTACDLGEAGLITRKYNTLNDAMPE